MGYDWPIHRVKAGLAGRSVIAAFQQLTPALRANYAAPRDGTLAAAFLRERLPAGKYAIYGAGTLGRQLFEALSERADIKIVAFLDQQAAHIGCFCDREVLSPDTAASLAVDGILVAHHHWEAGMVATLGRSGVPANRIFPVFGDKKFAMWSLERLSPQIDRWRNRNIKHLVVTCAEPQWSLLRDSELAAFLPPDQTLHVYFGRDEPIRHNMLDTVFPFADVNLSLVLLDALVEAIAPHSMYVKVSAHYGGQFLGAYLKDRFPSCIVAEEMYDQALMLTDRKLQDSYGCSTQDIQTARLAELASMHICDLVLTKNGGDAWDAACHGLAAPQAIYYPRIGPLVSRPATDAANDVLSIAFAGSLPRPAADSATPSDHHDMQYIEMVRRMQPNGRISVDLYNASHRFPEHDASYAAYQTMFGAGGPVRYFRGRPFNEMTQILPAYDFGWHVMHDGDSALVEPVSRVGIGNKFTTYLACGLPILIDPDFEYMAALISAYGAGLVVGAADLPDLPSRLLAADRMAMARGGAQLVDMMRTRNDAARNLLAERLSTGLERSCVD